MPVAALIFRRRRRKEWGMPLGKYDEKHVYALLISRRN
jgi:hypothetical protein